MSKYIDAERLNMEWQTLKPFGVTDTMIENLKWIVDRQPTIEVSEDCMSKAYLEQEIENQIMSAIDREMYWQGWNNALCKVVELIEDAPSVTTEQSSRVGEWHRVSADKYVQHAYHHFRCSECGEDTIGEPNYCPNCGAKMKG